jgi:hypothetical protein
MVLRIERSLREGFTVLALSGFLDADYTSELERLCGPATAYSRIIMDLRDLRLADRSGVLFLARCEESGVRLENCPDYVREWITRETGRHNEQDGIGEE